SSPSLHVWIRSLRALITADSGVVDISRVLVWSFGKRKAIGLQTIFPWHDSRGTTIEWMPEAPLWGWPTAAGARRPTPGASGTRVAAPSFAGMSPASAGMSRQDERDERDGDSTRLALPIGSLMTETSTAGRQVKTSRSGSAIASRWLVDHRSAYG